MTFRSKTCRTSALNSAAAGRAAHGEAQFRRRAVVVVVAGAHDWPHGAGVEQAVTDEPLVDIDSDHLAEYHVAVRWMPLVVGKRHRLHPFAFERTRRCRDPRRLDEPRRRR